MNKVVLADDRLFMAVVGPSASGKTRLIFDMLLNNTFEPAFSKIYYFYKEYQAIFDKFTGKLPIEYVNCLNFDLINSLQDCLLIFDDTCEEVYESKDFLKLATSGRHKRVSVIVVKHNLFLQSKLSRTIDLNTSHLVLFKSPRDVQQVETLGRQLNMAKFLKEAFSRATREAYGHLMVDLAPTTSDGLRYCSNVIGPLPSTFYLPTAKAVVTPLTNQREVFAYSKRV